MTQDNFADGSEFSAEGLDSAVNAINHEAVLSGGAPSVGTGDFDVDLTECDFVVGGSDYTASADTVTLSDPSANDRVDIVTATSTPGFSVTEGSPATNPNAPDIPNDEVLICAVFVASDASNLQTSDIHDYRVFLTRDAFTYKGNDIDSDGDGKVNDADAADLADDSNQLGGVNASEYNTFDLTSVNGNAGDGAVTNNDTGVSMGDVVSVFVDAGTVDVSYQLSSTSGVTYQTVQNGSGNLQVDATSGTGSQESITIKVLHQ